MSAPSWISPKPPSTTNPDHREQALIFTRSPMPVADPATINGLLPNEIAVQRRREEMVERTRVARSRGPSPRRRDHKLTIDCELQPAVDRCNGGLGSWPARSC